MGSNRAARDPWPCGRPAQTALRQAWPGLGPCPQRGGAHSQNQMEERIEHAPTPSWQLLETTLMDGKSPHQGARSNAGLRTDWHNPQTAGAQSGPSAGGCISGGSSQSTWTARSPHSSDPTKGTTCGYLEPITGRVHGTRFLTNLPKGPTTSVMTQGDPTGIPRAGSGAIPSTSRRRRTSSRVGRTSLLPNRTADEILSEAYHGRRCPTSLPRGQRPLTST